MIYNYIMWVLIQWLLNCMIRFRELLVMWSWTWFCTYACNVNLDLFLLRTRYAWLETWLVFALILKMNLNRSWNHLKSKFTVFEFWPQGSCLMLKCIVFSLNALIDSFWIEWPFDVKWMFGLNAFELNDRLNWNDYFEWLL